MSQNKTKTSSKKNTRKKVLTEHTPLTPKERSFINEYIKDWNGKQAAIKAGYKEKTAHVTASQLLTKPNIRAKILQIQEESKKNTIATAQEVMEYFTKVMKGEIKDQFGLDAPLSERTRAAQELAKRTIDIDNRLQGKEDATVVIKLDWERK